MATPLPSNLASFTLDELVRATSGVLAQRGTRDAFRSVVTDSRRVSEGATFVALSGDRFDGHAFVDEVVARGASALVVARDVSVPPGVTVVRVPDTLDALGGLGRHHTRRLRSEGALRTVIGITGSVGKTTTKEMLAAALAEDRPAGSVRATEGNLNNRIGVPMSLLALDASVELAVIEMGMNLPGEIARLARIAEPDLGMVTAVAAAHTEGVGSLDGVAREKSSLLVALPPGATTAISPADDAVIEPYLAAVETPLVRVGLSERADVRLLRSTSEPSGTRLVVAFDPRICAEPEARHFELSLPLLGAGAARNVAMTLAAVARLAGFAGLERARRALARIRPTPGRLALEAGTRGTLLLDDSYNASPRAMENALETAAELARRSGGRLVAVLGEMLELGALEIESHARVGETAARLGVSLLVACGSRMRTAAEEARELGCDFVLSEADPLGAVEPVRAFVRSGDVILVKGSRGLRMERVVEALRARGSSPPEGAASS
jgi:UDP-N-acetylmuramoyl-tripeptide--D-alanyl-D-alanine ligase